MAIHRRSQSPRLAPGDEGWEIVLADLLDAGFSETAVRRRVDSGGLTRVHPGIFSVGEPDDLARIEAALLACGPESMAAAQSAAAMDVLLPSPAAVHVAARRDGPRPKAVTVSLPRSEARGTGIPAPR